LLGNRRDLATFEPEMARAEKKIWVKPTPERTQVMGKITIRQ
jgi:hypothetical protein